MIHDIILALGGIGGEVLNGLINDDFTAASIYIHPCEKNLLKQIIDIADTYRAIQSFIRKASRFGDKPIDGGIDVMPGIYIRAFCDGMYECLESYRLTVIGLEENILKDPHVTLTGILAAVIDFLPLLNSLNSIINQIGTRKLHGCNILQLIHQNLLSGVDIIDKAMSGIMKQCHSVMLRQLTGWLLYGQLTDPYGEFFIECCSTSAQETKYSSTTTLDSENLPETQLTEIPTEDYRIVHELVPSYIPVSVAEKAKFIGVTVLLFSQDSEGNRAGYNRELHEALTNRMESSLLPQLTSIQASSKLNVSLLESVLDNIKSFVTQHLFSLAKDQANLMGEIELIKDIFLIGRGEVYVAFLNKTKDCLLKPVYSSTAKELNKTLSLSLANINLDNAAIMKKLSFKLPPKDTLSPKTTVWSAMSLQYNPPWPLHLLFPPSTIVTYNTIFKFLLKVKLTELNLHQLWLGNIKRKHNPLPAEVWTVQNDLMQLIHNLQCYLQLDVLESEYSILMTALRDTQDFEKVIHHHTMFLAHITAQAFLITEEVHNPDQPTIVKQHPVNRFIVNILNLCSEFCTEAGKEMLDLAKIKVIAEQLDSTLSMLMKLIELWGNRASGLPLLLLRLDYNHYFSGRNNL